MSKFEIARRCEDGVISTVVEDGKALEVFWTVLPEHMPVYATKWAAGADVRAVEDVVIPSIWKYTSFNLLQLIGVLDTLENDELGESDWSIIYDSCTTLLTDIQPTKVHTGIKVKLDSNEWALCANRSSGPKRGLVLANSLGIIDADYYNSPETDGEILFSFYNFSKEDLIINKGDRIGQILIQEFKRAHGAIEAHTNRVGGHGSTGV